jgi:hypothetical protein
MEGACGKILSTDDGSVVIKKIHRRKRAQQRTCSLSADGQARLQEWAATVCASSGFTRLTVPRAWGADRFTYKMERIDVSKPLELLSVKTHPVKEELRVFYEKARQASIFPADFELYIQPDGRVAMIDFDKFAQWKTDGSVVFPWGLELDADQVKDSLAAWTD